jgi:hypothetical protein
MVTAVDTVVDAVYDRVLAVIRQAQEANFTHAWELGRILDEALVCEEEVRGKGIAKALVVRLRSEGCEITAGTLYAYRRLHQAYLREQIPELVANGITQTHAQALAALPCQLRQEMETHLQEEREAPVSTRELKRLINDAHKDRVRTSGTDIAAESAAAREDGRTPALPTDIPAIAARHGPVPAPKMVADASAAAVDGDVETTVDDEAVGAELSERDRERNRAMAAGPREFAVNPVSVLKKADSTAIKMLAQAGTLVRALDEAERLGYDGERALRNFLDAAQSLQATLASYRDVLPELERRLGSAIRANDL